MNEMDCLGFALKYRPHKEKFREGAFWFQSPIADKIFKNVREVAATTSAIKKSLKLAFEAF